jgi:hypothetical protein
MKKLMNKVFFLAIVGTTIIGCEKEESNVFNDSESFEVKQKKAYNKSTEDTTYIAESDFEAEFELFAQDFFNNYPQGLIEIEFRASSATYALTTDEEGETGPDNEIIICRSNSFGDAARCKSYVDNDMLFAYVGCEAWILVRHHLGGTVYETHVDC